MTYKLTVLATACGMVGYRKSKPLPTYPPFELELLGLVRKI